MKLLKQLSFCMLVLASVGIQAKDYTNLGPLMSDFLDLKKHPDQPIGYWVGQLSTLIKKKSFKEEIQKAVDSGKAEAIYAVFKKHKREFNTALIAKLWAKGEKNIRAALQKRLAVGNQPKLEQGLEDSEAIDKLAQSIRDAGKATSNTPGLASTLSISGAVIAGISWLCNRDGKKPAFTWLQRGGLAMLLGGGAYGLYNR